MNPVCYVYHDFYRAEDWVSGCKDQCLRSCSPRGVALLYIGSQWGEKGSEVAFQFQKINTGVPRFVLLIWGHKKETKEAKTV